MENIKLELSFNVFLVASVNLSTNYFKVYTKINRKATIHDSLLKKTNLQKASTLSYIINEVASKEEAWY